MKDFPCKDCITLPICRHTGIYTNGVRNLAFRCPMLEDWLLTDDKSDLHAEKLFDAFDYFQRSWKDDHSM